MPEIIWVHRCLIVAASIVAQCRALAASLTPAAADMWTTALSPTGSAPATHYISTGLIDQVMADLLTSPAALAAGTGCSLAEAQALISQADVSDEEPFAALARLGLKLVETEQ